MSIETRLVERVVARADLESSPDARAAARVFMLDSIGVALSGSRVAELPALKLAAERWGAGAGARIWGSGERVPVATAAFINGYQIHNQEFDCVHEPAVVHPMAVVLATLIAWAEEHRAIAGADFVNAVCIAVDVAASLGATARTGLRFFRPAMCGALGATAGVAALARLDAATTHSALGITYSQLSGTMQAHREGSPVLPMQIGFNARAVLTAIELAQAGIAGPRDFLAGVFGYYRLFEPEWDAADLARRLAQDDHITQLSHKPFPSGRATHGAVDGVLELRRRHSFGAADVSSVLVSAPTQVVDLVDRPAYVGMEASYARLCLPYVVAAALDSGTVEVTDFDRAALREPARLALAARVRIERDANASLKALVPQAVRVQLTNGAEHRIDLPAMLGSPARPLTEAQRLDKFERCCRSAARPLSADRIARVVRAVAQLERCADVSHLVDLIVPEP